MKPLVSVITSTYKRHKELLERAIPSVKNQTYKNIEHIVISDGPDKTLRNLLQGKKVQYCELGQNWHSLTNKKSIGAIPRLVGTYLAKGQYIAYLDDDDEYLSDHVESLVTLIEKEKLDFAFSQMKVVWNDGREGIVGDGRIIWGGVGTPMLIHKTSLLVHAQWTAQGYAEDFNLYEGFLANGAKWDFLPKVTCIYYKDPENERKYYL